MYIYIFPYINLDIDTVVSVSCANSICPKYTYGWDLFHSSLQISTFNTILHQSIYGMRQAGGTVTVGDWTWRLSQDLS